MDRFTIRLPATSPENVVIPSNGRKAIVLADLPERVRATIHSGERYRVIAPDGRETTATIVVKGLTAIAFMDSDIGLELALSCEQFVSTQYLVGAPGLTINFDTGNGIVATSWVKSDTALSLDLTSGDVSVYLYGGLDGSLQTEFDVAGMLLVRRTKVADWTGYKMSELVGKTMREMIYTEVDDGRNS